jgi:hypothetical protein
MLRTVLGLLLLLALVTSAAQAAPILYATAATTGEVTSYCVGAGGGLDADPRQRITTNGRAPSRLITTTLPGGQFLYAAENDRVEVFRIGDGGRLTRQGRIPAQPIPDNPGSGLTNMNPHDISIGATAGGTQVLYVPQRPYDRIAAYPLDPTTGLSTVPIGTCDGGGQAGASCTPRDPADPCLAAGGTCTPVSDQTGSSCVLGPVPSEWEDVSAAPGLVYTSRAVTRGEVFTYQLAPDGNFADGTVFVTETIGPDVNPTQCTRTKGCTTGASCTTDADCTQAGQVERCVAGSCVNLSGPQCETNKDCPAPQTCATFGPCDQNAKGYPVNSADCTASIVLTDVDGQPIARTATPDSPLTVRGQIQPYARRRRLNGAGALILQEDLLYVSERFRRAISAFQLCPAGGMPPACPNPSSEFRKNGERCLCPESFFGVPDLSVLDLCPPGGFSVDAKYNKNLVCTVRNRQPRLAKKGGRTESDIRYNAMVLAPGMTANSILGSQFLDGRIDGYRLKDDGRLPREPTRRTTDNFRTSPFHLFLYRPADVRPDESAGVLYVAAGEVNRVQAYRLDRNGLPRDRNPFSETTNLADTFPNDATVVDLPGSCG